MTEELGRLVRFGLVGMSNTLLTVSLFVLLTHAGVAPTVASACGFALGAGNGYVWNRAWTFRAAGGPAVLGRYVAVQALGAALSAAGVALATTDLELRRLAAEVLVLPPVTIVTYLLARRVVFLQPASRLQQQPAGLVTGSGSGPA
jgi:putative flippase GtrA